jgi:hypothetical protein
MKQILENPVVQNALVWIVNTLLTMLLAKYAGAGKVWTIVKIVVGLLERVEPKQLPEAPK